MLHHKKSKKSLTDAIYAAVFVLKEFQKARTVKKHRIIQG